jgi:pimeloyl-ACP methyl ester carboxylesterase
MMDEKYIMISEKPLIKLRHVFFECKEEQYKHRIIVMIPGWLGNIEGILPLIEHFQKFASVISYDPRGHGKSSKPHKRGLYRPSIISKEFAKIIEHYKLKESEFYVWGSCAGIEIGYLYLIEKLGPKPKAFLAASPDYKNNTKWWFNPLKILPYPLFWLFYKLFFFFLNVYLKFKNPSEQRTLQKSKARIMNMDLYPLFRFLFEFIHDYDIRGREEKLDVPQIILYAQGDWFTKPENSMKLVQYHPDSELVNMGDVHRVYAGREEEVAQHVKKFIDKLEL